MDISVMIKRKSAWAPLFCLCGICLDSPAFGDLQLYTAGAPALSRSRLTTSGGQIYEVRFNPETFTADLVARSVEADGSLQRDQLNDEGDIDAFKGDWRARDSVDKQSQRFDGGSINTRAIITSGSDGTNLVGRRFTWNHTHNGLTFADGANEDLKSLLDPHATDEEKHNERFEDPVISWVRGDDKFEGVGLRKRDHALGNIVHSAPQFVGPPFQVYSFSNNPGYAVFKSSHASRTAMVYVGGAMLHGFNADDGTEVFAYIPHEILNDLEKLAAEDYPGFLLVDGTPTIEDAFGPYGTERCDQGGGETSCWLSVLIGGMGFGGSAIFALNVTDPVVDAETEDTAAGKLFLWEFKHMDLGHTTARPIIGRLSDGTWVTILGNGRGAGKAKLFVLNIATGELIQELELPSSGTGNGLSSPAAWDGDFDGDIDLVYAGDLEGNLWRFDFFSASSSGGASISFSDEPLISISDPNTSNPLPITTSPVVSLNPEGGLLVYFGTGMDIQNDNDSNGMFGIEDNGSALGINPILAVHAVRSHILESTPAENDPNVYRTLVAHNETEATVGWKLALPVGERILNDAVLSNRRISFTSVSPKADAFNQNWLTSLDFQTGGPPGIPFLDLNGDGVFDHRDRITDLGDSNENNGRTPIGLALGVGVVSGPTPADTANGRDILMVTRGMEAVIKSQNAGAGLPDGSFDLDTFELEGGYAHAHTHRYDDVFNLNGVNLLTQGGNIIDPPDVESATGILSQNKALLNNNREIKNDIYLQVVNPYSVDTPALAARRETIGLDGTLAPPPVVYFQCGTGGLRHVLDAPSFNMLPKSDRTCVTGTILELRVKFTSPNALRTTLPECVQTNQPGPALGDSTLGRNGSYRNGATTVQARRASNHVVFWEAVVYQHLDSDDTHNNAVSDASPGSNPRCDTTNQELRASAAPEFLDGSGFSELTDVSRGNIVIERTGGEKLTVATPVSRSQHTDTDGRVSWREVLE